jgi:hypothetical protein
LSSKEILINIVNQLPDEVLKEILNYIESNYKKQLEEKTTDLDSYYNKIAAEDSEVLKRLSE